VTMAVTIAGSIKQFTEVVLSSMRQKVADEVLVPLDAVAATATALRRRLENRARLLQGGSVTVAFTISMQSEVAADDALVAIAAKLTDTTAASTFLSTPALTVTVEQIEAVKLVVNLVVKLVVDPVKLVLVLPPPSQPLSPSSPGAAVEADDGGMNIALLGGIVGGAAGACLILAVLGGLFYLKSQKKPSKGGTDQVKV